MSKRSNYPVVALVVGLMCLGVSITPTPLWFRIIISAAGFIGLVIGIIGIKRMN